MRILIVLTGVVTALVPLILRPLNRLETGELPPLGYLPSLELRRSHLPFQSATVEQLRRANPAWVFIGDSMLGTRIDPQYLGELSTTGNEVVAFLDHAATGPAWWYLAFKNHLVASGARPRVTFIFFRDTNLTDTMFRLEGQYGHSLDEVARESEPALDALVARRREGAWFQAHHVIDRFYESNVAAAWMEPLVRRWWVWWHDPAPGAIEAFEWRMGQIFTVDQLRYDVAADLSAGDLASRPDFHRDLPTSVLPLIMELSHRHGLPVCFVRVQRRPEGGRPPEQSPALRQYVADLRAWLTDQGALFHDFTGDPLVTLDLYADGDHIGQRRRYTEIFRERLDPLFRAGAPVDGGTGGAHAR